MKNLNLNIRDLIFSSRCSLCGGRHCDKEPYLCYNCYKKISEKIKVCKVENLYYTTYYDRDIKRLVTSFKLKNRRYLGEVIGRLIEEKIKKIVLAEDVDLIIPVPISKKRKRSRGYNQVEDILKHVGIGYSTLKRVKNTLPMHSLLDKKLRKENVSGSFESELAVEGRNILIVDDIVTTGSTIREVIKTLEKNGRPRKVIVFTFALASTALVNDLSF